MHSDVPTLVVKLNPTQVSPPCGHGSQEPVVTKSKLQKELPGQDWLALQDRLPPGDGEAKGDGDACGVACGDAIGVACGDAIGVPCGDAIGVACGEACGDVVPDPYHVQPMVVQLVESGMLAHWY